MGKVNSYKKTWVTTCIVSINKMITMPTIGTIELQDNIVRIVANGREMKCRLGVIISHVKNSKKLGQHLVSIDKETGFEVHYTYGMPGFDNGAATISIGKPDSDVLITAKADAFDKWLKGYLKKRGNKNEKQTAENGTGNS